MAYRVFSLMWPASMQIYWNKRKRLHKKRVQLPQDWFGTQTWPPFHCFGTQIWPPWRHVKTHNSRIIFNSLSPGIKTSITLVRVSDISRGRGPAKFPKKSEILRNLPEIFPNTCRQNIFNTYLGYYTDFINPKHPNLARNFITATSKQCPKTTRRF